MKTINETCTMFEEMEISEQVYEGQTASKKIPTADAYHESHVRKRKGEESALHNHPEKGHDGKPKTKNTVSLRENTTGADETFLMHGPRHSSDECKLQKNIQKVRRAAAS